MTTCTDERSFLRAICSQPADDTVRLVYADWLEEHGRAERAEFIRVQCDIERNPGFLAPEVDPRRKRERELLTRLVRTWFPIPLSADAMRVGATSEIWSSNGFHVVRFTRGFVSELTCTAEDWLKHADALCASQPIERVTLTTVPDVKYAESVRPGPAGRARAITVRARCGGYEWERCLKVSDQDTLLSAPGAAELRAWEQIRHEMTPHRLFAAQWPGIAFEVPA